MRSGFARFVVLAGVWISATGFTPPRLQRVGPDHAGAPAIDATAADEQLTCNAARGGRLRLDGDVRTTLPRCTSQVLNADVAEGCSLRLGFANLGQSGALQFRVAWKRGDQGFVDEPGYDVKPGKAWTDVSLTVHTPQPVKQVRFTVSGDAAEQGVFARPIVSCAGAPDAKAVKTPRNVLLVSLDTLRADHVGVNGQKPQLTPNLDRIARDGTTFLEAYSQYPNTHGSHAVLFTGLYASRTGMGGAFREALAPKQATIASELAQRGYVTVAFTEDAYVGSVYGFDRGFDTYHDGTVTHGEFQGYAAKTFGRAIDWLRHRPDQPFFMFLHTYEVHTPYAPSPEALKVASAGQPGYHGRLGPSFDGLQTTSFNFGQLKLGVDDMQHIERLYAAETWTLDQQIGVLFAALREMKLLDSTMVVFFSDHGEAFGEHGYMAHGEDLHHEALHVPLIFVAPGIVPAGGRIQSPVGLIDVPATIAELLELGPILPGTSTRSLAPQMRGQNTVFAPVWSELVKSATACGAPQGDGFASCRLDGTSVRDADYAYYRSATLRRQWLYDRKADPGELHDLSIEKPELVAKYRKLVDAFRRANAAKTLRTDARVDVETEARLRALGYVK